MTLANPYRVVLCLGCRAEWQVPIASPSPGYDYDLINCHCPIGSEPEFVWADQWTPDNDRPDWYYEGFNSLREAENAWQAEAESRDG